MIFLMIVLITLKKNQQMTKKCPHLQIVVLFSRTKVKLYFAIANALRLGFNPVQCKCFQRCMIFWGRFLNCLLTFEF